MDDPPKRVNLGGFILCQNFATQLSKYFLFFFSCMCGCNTFCLFARTAYVFVGEEIPVSSQQYSKKNNEVGKIPSAFNLI